jgi:DNA-binding transcriptional MerR regulator
MPDDPYSLADLARLADVTPRTVRYYVAQGLLPSPEAAGPATRYGEGHLARLRLIRRLQREHLPLAEIRAQLERMSDDEVAAALDADGATGPVPTMSTTETLAYVRGLMARAGVSPRFYDRAAEEPAGLSGQVVLPADAPGLANRPTPPAAAPMLAPALLARRATPPPDLEQSDLARSDLAQPAPRTPTSPGPSRSTSGDRSTWERLVVTPDVEIHVRRPLDRRTNKRVDQLARMARDLFEDEP